MTNKIKKDLFVDKAWGLLYRHHQWTTKANLRGYSISTLKEIIKELEEKEKE